MTKLFTYITYLINSTYLIFKHYIESCMNEYLQQEIYSTGGSPLSCTVVKPDSHLAQIFFFQNLVSFFLYYLM